jgi:HSP20 family protein
MSEVHDKKMRQATDRSRKALFRADRLIEKIGQGVYNLLATRGVLDGAPLSGESTAGQPARGLHAEVLETEAEFTVHVTIPGFEPGDIDVTAKPRELVIQAQQGAGGKAAPESQRRDGGFRRIPLRGEVDVEKVTSTLKNGILTIVAPKSRAAGARTGPRS